MNLETVQNYKLWFEEYAKSFYTQDRDVHKNVILKQQHTYRVCENIVKIAESIGLSQNDIYLAEVIALFHDVGRFEQFKKYKTFKDNLSENHALMSLKTLEEKALLRKLSPDEQQIIEHAIKYHNSMDIPQNEPDEYILFEKLIRDADKLDIFKIVTEYDATRKENPNIALEQLEDTNCYDKYFVSAVLNGENISYSRMKTYSERKLLEVGWINDINFKYSLSVIKREKYIEKLVSALPDNDDIRKVYNYAIDKLG